MSIQLLFALNLCRAWLLTPAFSDDQCERWSVCSRKECVYISVSQFLSTLNFQRCEKLWVYNNMKCFLSYWQKKPVLDLKTTLNNLVLVRNLFIILTAIKWFQGSCFSCSEVVYVFTLLCNFSYYFLFVGHSCRIAKMGTGCSWMLCSIPPLSLDKYLCFHSFK